MPKYALPIRILHWLMAIIILGLIGMGWYMAELPKDSPLRDSIYALHKSFGITILLLFFVRVFFRFTTKIPPLPASLPKLTQKLAEAGHGLLYILIGLVPLSGYAMTNLYGYPAQIFGLTMPKLFPDNRSLGAIAKEIHEILPYVFLGLIILHILAALQHRFFDKKENDVLGRMV